MSISIRDLKYSYRKSEVLRGITFSVGQGEVLFVLGPNGAGKSTLFKCILRILSNYGGGIFIDGKDIQEISPRQMAKRIAYIPQSHVPKFDYTVLDIVLMGMTPEIGMFSAPDSFMELQAREILDSLEIGYLWDREYSRLSGGERQLAIIARALAQNAKVLVMDEPAANLDYGNQIRLMEEVKRLSKRGYSIILSTHNLEHAFMYADSVLVLKDGKAVQYGSPGHVLTEETIKSVFYSVDIKLFDFILNKRGPCMRDPASSF